ncbi:unnamed protein product [Rotaria magnacalcarata]|uniref:PNPLA domain-containing protein n=5 Tax=Rotaria magnacalcarata TaxID=392030 RepID=A0A816S6Z0_9BILA|nr:unnamed protein product [Rotaria magnacalcarata]CAF2081710.1 unnamed protein product [Rotaria magnacalcarata]CAF2140116.1 unnamed protein product [Rotaria magnacalcarata]CAF3732978.1 unnamed protein product [Rotaria magnacalcarata]CAF4023034.1 unnamed protein product [Rotaria magnacalcarata]
MLISSQSLVKKSTLIKNSVIYCSQSTNVSLGSILFPEPKPIDKNETPSSTSSAPQKSTTKQQAQNVVSSAADAAVNVLGAGWDALSAVSNRITGLTNLPRKDAITNKQLESIVRVVTPETLGQRTKSLIDSVKAASSTLSQATRIEELSNYLLHQPDGNYFTKKERLVPYLLYLRRHEYRKSVVDKAFIGIINECLTLANYVQEPRGKGIRLLSIDGGGMRGLVSINALRRIEDLVGEPVYKLFDYMSGVSTGAVITAMLGGFKVSLDECEEIYKHFSSTVFQRNKALGISSLITSQSYYDTKNFEKYLRSRMGERLMVKSSLDADSPKFSLISALTVPNGYRLFLFRNYSILMSPHAHYDGTSKYKVWEAVRASTCAPGYFEEYLLDGNVFQDGGLIANNPTSIALHECKLLWPGEDIQCVVSLGNGRPTPDVAFQSKSMTLKQKLSSLVDSVTNTETIHVCLHDLLPTNIYFRLNPFMSADFVLDEHRPERIEQMLRDAQKYIRQNEYKFLKLAQQLTRLRSPLQRLLDKLKKFIHIYT